MERIITLLEYAVIIRDPRKHNLVRLLKRYDPSFKPIKSKKLHYNGMFVHVRYHSYDFCKLLDSVSVNNTAYFNEGL